MDTAQVVLLIALIVAGGALAFRYWIRSQATKQAAEVTGDVYAVWAAQGPFDSGTQSAGAMRYAYVAVRGPKEADRMSDAIAKHAQAFDAAPSVWEKLRLESLDLAGPKTQDHVTVAKGLAAADSLNKDLFEAGGHRLEYARQPDGRLTFAYKQIWSDEDVQRKKEADAETITKSIGTSLLEDNSTEGQRLVQFLLEIHRSNPEHGAETSMALGRLWLSCLNFAKENPDSDIGKAFTVLNDAHTATRPGLDSQNSLEAVSDARTLTDEQIGQLSDFLGERSLLTQRGETYLFESGHPKNLLAATTVDTTWMLICMRSAGIDRDSAASALREIIWRMLNRWYPAEVAEKSIEGISIETQVFLADQHQSGDPESQSRVAIYAVHLLYDLDFKEHGELMGKMAASFLLGGDIGTVIAETDRVLRRGAERQ